MSATPQVLALGLVDELGVAGSDGLRFAWDGSELEPCGDRRAFRAVFGRVDATFRRLDAVARVLVLAAEAAQLARRLDDAAREETGVVMESCRGVLDTDLRWAAALDHEQLSGSLFPYTLLSSALGELAQRHALEGPTLCLSTAGPDEGAALHEAARLLEDGAAQRVLVGCVETGRAAREGLPASVRAVVALLGYGTPTDAPCVAPWPGDVARPWARLARALRD